MTVSHVIHAPLSNNYAYIISGIRINALPANMCSNQGEELDMFSSKVTQQKEEELQIVLYEPEPRINRAW